MKYLVVFDKELDIFQADTLNDPVGTWEESIREVFATGLVDVYQFNKSTNAYEMLVKIDPEEWREIKCASAGRHS